MKFSLDWWTDADGNEVAWLHELDTQPTISSVMTSMHPGDTVTITRTDGVS